MKLHFTFRFGLILCVTALLSACAGTRHSQDELTGNWLQRKGTNNLVWQFHADGTMSVVNTSGIGKRNGIYRHLGGKRVAIDFGENMSSIVHLTILGKELFMTNPNGDTTTLLRVESTPASHPKPQPKPQDQPSPKPKAQPQPKPQPESNVGKQPL